VTFLLVIFKDSGKWEAEAKGDPSMNEVKNVVVKVEGRTFALEVDIEEENLITALISTFGLFKFIKRRAPVRVVQSSNQPLSKSHIILSKALHNIRELGEWAQEVADSLKQN
jgi:hypothetical protein